MTRKLLPGLAALGLFGGLAFAAAAEPPAATAKAPVPDPSRKIVRWPGGWMYLDAPGVIYHDNTVPKGGGSMNVITDSANGVGNKIVIDNGGKPGTTILRNVRNGVGNSVTVTPEGPVIDLSAKPAVKLDPNLYKGRNAKFWTKKVWSDAFDCNLYWCPKAELWFKYDRASDRYLPMTGTPAPEKP